MRCKVRGATPTRVANSTTVAGCWRNTSSAALNSKLSRGRRLTSPDNRASRRLTLAGCDESASNPRWKLNPVDTEGGAELSNLVGHRVRGFAEDAMPPQRGETKADDTTPVSRDACAAVRRAEENVDLTFSTIAVQAYAPSSRKREAHIAPFRIEKIIDWTEGLDEVVESDEAAKSGAGR